MYKSKSILEQFQEHNTKWIVDAADEYMLKIAGMTKMELELEDYRLYKNDPEYYQISLVRHVINNDMSFKEFKLFNKKNE